MYVRVHACVHAGEDVHVTAQSQSLQAERLEDTSWLTHILLDLALIDRVCLTTFDKKGMS